MGEVSVNDLEPVWDLSIAQRGDPVLRQVTSDKEKGGGHAPGEWAACPRLKSYAPFWEKLQFCGGILAFVEGNAPRDLIPKSMIPVILLQSLHNSKTGGHLDTEKLMERVQARFFFARMDRGCEVVQNMP